MPGALIGYARCSTDQQDLTAQCDLLHELDVPADRIYLDHGLSGTHRKRPGLDQALAAVRVGDTLIVPTTFAEFEVDLLRLRTREGMAVARAKGRLRGQRPKLSPKQQAKLRRMHTSGDYSITDLAELFCVSRPTVYRTLRTSAP